MACEREEFQTRNPAAAAAMPPMNQTNFFMRASLPPSIINENGRGGRAEVAGGSREDNGRLDDGVMVGPGGLEAVGKLFYRLHARAIPDEETYHCCCQTAHQPD
jgi:hypothetical protein